MHFLHLSFLYAITFTLSTIANNIELTISGSQQTKMPITILIPRENNEFSQKIASVIKKDLLFVDQFEPSIKTYDQNLSKKELRKKVQQLAHLGVPLALFIKSQSEGVIEYHLYDTIQCTALTAKKHKTKESIHSLAHQIADDVRKTLTGCDHLFSSKIAYCKKDPHKNMSKIYIADFDGSNEELLVDSSTMAIAPRWHRNKGELFYSEYTDTYLQLNSIDIKNKKPKNTQGNHISPFENGINMFVDISPEGEDFVFCASQGNGNCQIYLYKDGQLKRCTNNPGNNDCPIFIDNERICFCSNFQTGNPQIYIGNIKTGHVQRITHGGYCTSPSYCSKTNQIAYHKMIQGIMQIMIYDCATKTHIQITHDQGNKHNVSWSPDGIFLLYAHEGKDNNSHLKTFNTLTKNAKTLSKDYCSYPHWSYNPIVH